MRNAPAGGNTSKIPLFSDDLQPLPKNGVTGLLDGVQGKSLIQGIFCLERIEGQATIQPFLAQELDIRSDGWHRGGGFREGCPFQGVLPDGD